MKKQTFIDAIKAIELQCEHDIEFSNKLGSAFPNAHEANLLPDNHFLSNALFQLLQEEMEDHKGKESWIEWFCWETDFGKESFKMKAYDEKGNELDLSDSGKLYDFLIGCKI